jgi:uncharacterized protein (DUF488 family)
MPRTIFTIGHSNHSWEHFESLLRYAGVTAIADVRSSPYSRHTPHFSQKELKFSLAESGITYSFLGNELGGRPQDRSLYSDGIADYEKMAKADLFHQGIARVVTGTQNFNIALLCSEQDPLDCHRCLLVGRELHHQGFRIDHILHDASIQTHSNIEDRLLAFAGTSEKDLFMPSEERIKAAYRERARRVAFAEIDRVAQGSLLK